MTDPKQPPYDDFIKSSLDLYHGPTIEVVINARGFHVSRALLCHHSSYPRAMLAATSDKGRGWRVGLGACDGAVSERGFSLLLQLLYTGQTVLRENTPQDQISALIDLARCANYLGIGSLERHFSQQIKTIILQNTPDLFTLVPQSESYIYKITAQHLFSAFLLPKGHALRALLAKAMIKAYLARTPFKFHEQLNSIPAFQEDVLDELKAVLRTAVLLPVSGSGISQNTRRYFEHFDGQKLLFDPCTLLFKWEGEGSSRMVVSADPEKARLCGLLGGFVL